MQSYETYFPISSCVSHVGATLEKSFLHLMISREYCKEAYQLIPNIKLLTATMLVCLQLFNSHFLSKFDLSLQGKLTKEKGKRGTVSELETKWGIVSELDTLCFDR